MDISVILKFGFERKTIVNRSLIKRINLDLPEKVYAIIGDYYYNFSNEEYCSYHEGFIKHEYNIYKCRGLFNRHVFVLFDGSKYDILNSFEILENITKKKYNEIQSLEFVYIIESHFGMKIGQSKNIVNRTKVFNVKMPFKWSFLSIFVCKNSKNMEKFLHKVFSSKRINGEWFDLDYDDINNISNFILSKIPR